jgi:phage protein D
MVSAPAPKRLISQVYLQHNGNEIRGEVADDLLRLRIEGSVHLPDMAVLELANPEFRWSNEERFKIGDELKIGFGDADEKSQTPVFAGEITACEVEIAMTGDMHLRIRAYDRAHRLHRGRFTRAFLQMSDSDIANKIGQELGFQVDAESTKEVHEYILQANQTNWDFLRQRAAVNGFELQVHEKTLVFKPPPSTPKTPVDLALREELLSFRARMTAGEQVDEVEVRAWDPVKKKVIIGKATEPKGTPRIGESRTGGQVASSAFHKKATMVVAREPVYSQEQAQKLAQVVLNELAGNFVTAEGIAMGDPKLQLGSDVNLTAVGNQFTGKYTVTQIRHEYEPNSYMIYFEVTGRRSTDLASLVDVAPETKSHIYTGVVTNTRDPLNLGRVKVEMPWLGQQVESNWCRVAAPGAGKDRGMQYLPEVGDEVLIVAADMNTPYIIGGLWNSDDTPPLKNSEAAPSGAVEKRIIRSRTGHTVLIDDSPSSPGITIEDSAGNKVYLDTRMNNLNVDVKGDIKLKAGKNLELDAGMDLKLSSKMNISMEALMNANMRSLMQLQLEGAASAKLVSAANAGIAAPMVTLG